MRLTDAGRGRRPEPPGEEAAPGVSASSPGDEDRGADSAPRDVSVDARDEAFASRPARRGAALPVGLRHRLARHERPLPSRAGCTATRPRFPANPARRRAAAGGRLHRTRARRARGDRRSRFDRSRPRRRSGGSTRGASGRGAIDRLPRARRDGRRARRGHSGNGRGAVVYFGYSGKPSSPGTDELFDPELILPRRF